MELKKIDIRHHSMITSPKLALIATCVDEDRRPNAITLGWHTPLSSVPPLVGIAIAPARYSHDMIEKTREFTLNIMGVEHEKATHICGTVSGRSGDKFLRAGLTLNQGVEISVPSIAEAIGVIECRVVDSVITGDHTFFIGEVMWAGCVCGNLAKERDAYALMTLLYLHNDIYGKGAHFED